MTTLAQYMNQQDDIDKACERAVEDIRDQVIVGLYDEHVIDRVNNDHDMELSVSSPDEYLNPWREYYADDIATWLVYDSGYVDLWDYR